MTFNNLPNELLLHIFAVGCEEELYKDPYQTKPCFRQPKEFARLARQVCVHWKALIDHPSHTSFWIARLATDQMGRGRRFEPDELSPAQQLTIFYRTLLSSQGCDLSIRFYTASQNVRIPGGEYATATRLILYAMDMLTPYQNQITSICLLNRSSDACIRLLELLTGHWKDMPRLSEVQFRSNTTVMTIPELIEKTSDFGYGSLLTKRANRMTQPVTMRHLRRLVSLVVPLTSWLNEDLILLPTAIRHLEIASSAPDDLFLLCDYLKSQQSLRNHLRSITIGYIRSAELPSARKASQRLTLPSLYEMKLRSSSFVTTVAFFMHLFCPSLESVTLDLGFTEYMSPIQLEQVVFKANMSESQILASDEANASVVLQYPALKSLTIRVESNWQIPYCLRMFSASTIQTLSLSLFGEDGRYGLPSDDELGNQINSATSKFHPRSLYLSYTNVSSFSSVWSIMCCMDTRLLEKLEIQLPVLKEDDSGLGADQGISMFNLTDLSVHGPGHHLRRFMIHLEADRLVALRVYISDIGAPAYPGVHELDTYDLLRNAIVSFRDTLCPTENGIVPFPRLADFYVLCKASKWVNENQKGPCINEDSEPLGELLVDMLTHRALSGAIPLHLTKPVRLSEAIRYGGWTESSIDFEAHSDSKPQ